MLTPFEDSDFEDSDFEDSDFEDSDELPTLLRRLVDRVDPNRLIYRAEVLEQRGTLGGNLVRLTQNGAFKTGFKLRFWVHEGRVVWYDLPKRGDQFIIKGSTAMLRRSDESIRVYSDLGRNLHDVGKSLVSDLVTAEAHALPFGRELSHAAASAIDAFEDATERQPKLPMLLYFFGKLWHFYFWQIPLLEDPETRVIRLPEDNSILDHVSGRFDLGDRSRWITLDVRYPRQVSPHSRRNHLVFNRETGLMSYFHYGVDLLHPKLQAWHRIRDWHGSSVDRIRCACQRDAVVMWDKRHPQYGDEVPYSMRYSGIPLRIVSSIPEGRRFISPASSARGEGLAPIE